MAVASTGNTIGVGIGGVNKIDVQAFAGNRRGTPTWERHLSGKVYTGFLRASCAQATGSQGFCNWQSQCMNFRTA